MSVSNPIYISSIATWLPEHLTPIKQGVASKEYSSKDAESYGYRSIAIAPSNISVDMMALTAAKAALDRANILGNQLELLAFNAIHRHGHPQLWCPASCLQQALSAEEAIPLSIYQGCNGQLLSISVISQYLQASAKEYALSVTADTFNSGGINRWHGDYGIVYGDAATALVLSKNIGVAKILAMKTVSAPALEALHRFSSSFHALDTDCHKKLYDVRLAKKSYLKQHGKEAIKDATKKSIATLWEKIFSSDGVSPDDIKYFIFPNLSKEILEENYFFIYPKAKSRSLMYFGHALGHLGASDCMVGFDYLLKNDALKSGDKILCVGAGSGFSWSFMLLEKV